MNIPYPSETITEIRQSPATRTPGMDHTFTATSTFTACRTAENWLAQHGYSVGRMQGKDPRGILRGVWDIQKWRNLSCNDRTALHGVMTGDMRNGPVHVRLWDEALVGAPPCE